MFQDGDDQRDQRPQFVDGLWRDCHTPPGIIPNSVVGVVIMPQRMRPSPHFQGHQKH